MSKSEDGHIISEAKYAREFSYRGKRIGLSVLKGAPPFTPDHITRIRLILDRFREVDASSVGSLGLLRSMGMDPWGMSEDREDVLDKFGFKIGDHAQIILPFFEIDMALDQPHRFSPTPQSGEPGFVDRLSGRLIYSLSGMVFSNSDFESRFRQEWMQRFGWKWRHHFYPPSTTSQPERCIGGATGRAVRWGLDVDIQESVAALLINPDLLNVGKRSYLEEQISAYQRLH